MNISMDARYSPVGNLGLGDVHTLLPIKTTYTDDETKYFESSTEGMPFYFKDLRDNSFIFFRAYLDGLNEQISPNWSPETYVGRSEPVYTYTNAEREIGFTLKLAAGTKDELNMIYAKLNRLTSLCYPEYKKEEFIERKNVDEGETVGLIGDQLRTKAPLVKLRIGELFGSAGNEVTGFIKSLANTFPDNSPWELKHGERVPKYIDVSITFQVMHSRVPSLSFAQLGEGDSIPTNTFYGINQADNINVTGNIIETSA
tara:strand:- start:42 stop:812 length:771 start_codon:yes stop_codon:yes gene_type:complete